MLTSFNGPLFSLNFRLLLGESGAFGDDVAGYTTGEDARFMAAVGGEEGYADTSVIFRLREILVGVTARCQKLLIVPEKQESPIG